MSNSLTGGYRKDIDGLRAIAVMSVILFHLGYVQYGYLGVDIFFVISGYLITSIIYGETITGKFSVKNFYLRRVRRIIPLVLFTSMVALVIGFFVMLPNDLENLSQSVIATNLFANNILQVLTLSNYWALSNEFKPLMHTWSLGVEEQFYLIYPLLFLLFSGRRLKWLIPLLVILTIVSAFLFFKSADSLKSFYLIQYRFFELSVGGLGAIVFRNRFLKAYWTIPAIVLLLAGLFTRFNISENYYLIIVIAATFILLTVGGNGSKARKLLLENSVMAYLGKISFSLYMWHQIVIAFARYIYIDHLSYVSAAFLLAIIVLLSAITYKFVETPFRNTQYVPVPRLLLAVVTASLVLTSSAFYLFGVGGIWRSVPELGIDVASAKFAPFSKKPNPHISYNARIYDLDKNFTENSRKKVLVIGNSFSRDFVNILLESPYRDSIEISYVFDIYNHPGVQQRLNRADFVFFSKIDYSQLLDYMKKFTIDTQKVKNVGTKNFGTNNGLYFNNKGNKNYCGQRTNMEYGNMVLNNRLKQEWRDKYIDLIALVVDENGKMPVFTNDCKFISQDTRHLTQAGARYFAGLLNFNHVFGKQ